MTFNLEKARDVCAGMERFRGQTIQCTHIEAHLAAAMLPEALAEIERLRAELIRVNNLRETEIDQAGAAERIYLEGVRLKDARIAELEKWLKKERSARLLEKSGSILLAYLKENEIDFDEFFDGKALEQLQAEGKLGNSDHSPDATKMVWQITEERRSAIQWAEEMAGDCKAGDARRAMLEASQ